MRKKNIAAIAIQSFALVLVLATAYPASAQDAATSYPNMAPIAQYLMERTAEITLARSAAPDSISRDADVVVLGPHGFETAVKGINGFVCIVERSWTGAPDPDFWNPKVRVPMCLNAPAARSYLLRITKITDLILAGRTKAQTEATMATAINKKELPPMEPGAMGFMLGKEGYGGDTIPHWPPHVMFFFSQFDPASWGANLPGSPIVGMTDTEEQLTSFVVVAQHWADGSAAPQAEHTH